MSRLLQRCGLEESRTGTDNPIVSGSLLVCGVTIMLALPLTLYGLLRARMSGEDASA